eukprot:1762561-Amphidinium_carterae.3
MRLSELRPQCTQLHLPVPKGARAAHHRGLLRQHAAFELPDFTEPAPQDGPAGCAYRCVGFTCLSWNVCRLSARLAALQAHLRDTEYDVMFLSETQSHLSQDHDLKGYTKVGQCVRADNKGGGAAMYVHVDCVHKTRVRHDLPGLHHIHTRVHKNNGTAHMDFS